MYRKAFTHLQYLHKVNVVSHVLQFSLHQDHIAMGVDL
jgi:hypothetical protein